MADTRFAGLRVNWPEEAPLRSPRAAAEALPEAPTSLPTAALREEERIPAAAASAADRRRRASRAAAATTAAAAETAAATASLSWPD